MFIFKKVSDLQRHLQSVRSSGKRVGFAPTMGALHDGHLSLIAQANQACDISVCSIFVNPTQFNDKSDLDKYPRTTEKDIDLLLKAGCHVLFLPDVEEVYPPDFDYDFEVSLEGLDQGMEGAFRPGHFKGMVQVVRRLLQIVEPQQLFMGQKDFQQYSICKHMIKVCQLPVQIVCSPIIREVDGLAMSSRNVRLDADARALAPEIYKALQGAQALVKEGKSVAEIKNAALSALTRPGFDVDYFEIVDEDTLVPISKFEEGKRAVACTTVRCGGVRLLDNAFLT